MTLQEQLAQIEEAQALLDEALSMLRKVKFNRNWADAYILPSLQDLINSGSNRYNQSLEDWANQLRDEINSQSAE